MFLGSASALSFFSYLCVVIRKKNMDFNRLKKTAELVASLVLMAFGIVLLCIGLWCPPIGQIHSSVLVAFGEVGTFSAALLGIDYHYRSIIEKSNNKK